MYRMLTLFVLGSLVVGCGESRIPSVANSNPLIRIQSMKYGTPGEDNSRRPSMQTSSITDQATLKDFARFLGRQKPNWQPIETRARQQPLATFDAVCFDGKTMSFALRQDRLETQSYFLPITSDQYRTIERICFEE